MGTRLIDLSMPVHGGMVTFPRIVKPTLEMFETWQEFAERIGAAAFGATWLTASYRIELSDHVGTHMDALRHLRDDAPGPEGIPLEYCYGDGVILDFRHKEPGAVLLRFDDPCHDLLDLTRAGKYCLTFFTFGKALTTTYPCDGLRLTKSW